MLQICLRVEVRQYIREVINGIIPESLVVYCYNVYDMVLFVHLANACSFLRVLYVLMFVQYYVERFFT